MRPAFVLVVFLFMSTSVVAADVVLHSPKDNVTTGTSVEFIFTVGGAYRDAQLSECTLHLNGAPAKTLGINAKLGGQSRRFTEQLEPGSYEWRITCTSDNGTASSDVYTLNSELVLESPVTVMSSGITRGSLLHSFTMRNSPEQPPVEVPGVRPGDLIGITINIPPSSLEREFYVRSMNVQDGQNYARLSDGLDSWDLYLGQNYSLDIQGMNVIGSLAGLQQKEATFIFYASVTGAQEPAEPTPPTPVPTPPEEPAPEPEPEQPEPALPPEPEPPRAPEPAPERQGFFSWILSLLARIFGT